MTTTPGHDRDADWKAYADAAPAGYVWECQACGKRARDVYGHTGDRGWDVSCAMNAALVPDKF